MKLFFFILLSILLLSCSFNYNYIASDVTVPMVEEKGQFNAGVNLSTEGAIEVSYGISDKWATFGNAHYGQGPVYSYNFGLGYYRSFEKIGFETFVGFGAGGANYENSDVDFSNTNIRVDQEYLLLSTDNRFMRLFLQPTLRLTESSENLQVGITTQLAYIRSNHWNNTYKDKQNIETTVNLDEINDFSYGFYLTLRWYSVASKRIHFLFQMGAAGVSSSTEEQHYWGSNSVIRVGIFGSFWK